MADSLILMVMALVVFGPRRLPQIGRQIGKLMYEFRKASNDFKFQMEEELRNAEEADRRKKEEERLKLMALAPAAEASAEPQPEGSVHMLEAPAQAGGVESPYPEEFSYPPLANDAAMEGRAQLAESEAPAAPRIQPPSTGEQVSATPPNSLAAPGDALDTETGTVTALEGDIASEAAAEAPAAQPSPVTEQAAQHG